MKDTKTVAGPSGLTLPELRERLGWFSVGLTLTALRQTLRALGVRPYLEAAGRSGRGRSAYYDYAVLWMLAAAYHVVTDPKAKLETIRERLLDLEEDLPERFSISEFFGEEDAPVAQDHSRLRLMYLSYATDLADGIDVRLLTSVADHHWSEVGLNDPQIHKALVAYKRRVLRDLGVPGDVANSIDLCGSGAGRLRR